MYYSIKFFIDVLVRLNKNETESRYILFKPNVQAKICTLFPCIHEMGRAPKQEMSRGSNR